MPASKRFDFSPHSWDDLTLFLRTKVMREMHDVRSPIDEAHQGPEGAPIASPERCGGCRLVAAFALNDRAAIARAKGWTRERSLAELDVTGRDADDDGEAIDRPEAYATTVRENAVREAILKHRTRIEGARAKPMTLPMGVFYGEALDAAHRAGRLCVAVDTAQLFLGKAISAVQDPQGVVEPGQRLPWRWLTEAIEDAGHPLPASFRADELWNEIVAACAAHPPAYRLLEDHILHYSGGLARQHTAGYEDDEGATVDAIATATGQQSVTEAEDSTFAELVTLVAAQLRRLRTVDEERARALALRALRDRFAGVPAHPELPDLLDRIAAEAVASAGPSLAVQDAAATLGSAGSEAVREGAGDPEAEDAVRAALDAWAVRPPVKGKAVVAWVANLARDARLLARRGQHG
jgi:hypothetical protein